ncbi:MAG: hypothetical protein M3Z24_08690 [Chloroflexota bacterium]|nr:hypothetical protein [Chloroflexota bacterium]
MRQTNTVLLSERNRLTTSMHTIFQKIRTVASSLTPKTAPQLLVLVGVAKTPVQLNKAINELQDYLWNLPMQEQIPIRNYAIAALTTHVLQGRDSALRLEAARWLRLNVQAGFILAPEDVFVTLVTAATTSTELEEQQAYLKMIFECFWPFRYPNTAYAWKLFPRTEVFYPLAPLLASDNIHLQDALIGIFAELPSLDDVEIVRYLLPVALSWSASDNPERRQRVATLLTRIADGHTDDALSRLEADSDPTVRDSAKYAAIYRRKA